MPQPSNAYRSRLAGLLSICFGVVASASLLTAQAIGGAGPIESIQVDFEPSFFTYLEPVKLQISGRACNFAGFGAPTYSSFPAIVFIPLEHSCGSEGVPTYANFSASVDLPQIEPRSTQLWIVDGANGPILFSAPFAVYERKLDAIRFEDSDAPLLTNHEIRARARVASRATPASFEWRLVGDHVVFLEWTSEAPTEPAPHYAGEIHEIVLPFGPLPAGNYDVFLAGARSTNSPDFPGYGDLAHTTISVYDPASCVPSEVRLCLRDNRFAVEMDWTSWGDRSGPGSTIVDTATDAAGAFYTTEPSQPEVTVKILDRCFKDGVFWVFASWQTHAGVTLRITDTKTAATRTYEKPRGRLPPAVVDRQAFDCS